MSVSKSPLEYAKPAKRENGAHHPADSPWDRAYHSASTRLIRRAPDPACAEPDRAKSPECGNPAEPGWYFDVAQASGPEDWDAE
jgi:hypothetical protein